MQTAARIICFAAISMAFTATGVKATAIIESSDREYLVFVDNAAGTRYATDQIVLPPGDGRRIQTYYNPGGLHSAWIGRTLTPPAFCPPWQAEGESWRWVSAGW